MLETDLDIALSQGKTIDAREFAQQLILRGQPPHEYPRPCCPIHRGRL